MKATVLHTESSVGWGGQEIRIISEAVHLGARGHRVIIACPRGSELYQRALRVGLPVIAMPFRRAIDPLRVWRVYQLLKSEKVEILNTHSSVDSWVASLAARLAGVPIVRTRHISVPIGSDPFSRLIYSRLCDRIVTTGEAIRQLLLRKVRVVPSKVVSIPTGVNLNAFDPRRTSGAAVRAEFGFQDGIALVGMVAVLRSWKGHRRFLEAVPLILGSYPQARFFFVGEGPQRENIRRGIEEMGLTDAVVMVGHREDVPDIFAALDVVVSASTAAEGVPQTLVQALAMERPVVATDVGGVGEIIREGETGLLVQPENPAALAEAVAALLRDPGRGAALGAAGRRLVEKQFSLETMVGRLEALYAEILAGRRGG